MDPYQARKFIEFQSIKDRVTYILANYSEARNSDSVLIALYLEYAGVETWSQFKEVANKKQFSFESIRRARQIIQAAGEHLPTDEAVRKRRRLQSVYMLIAQGNKREMFPQMSPSAQLMRHQLQKEGHYNGSNS